MQLNARHRKIARTVWECGGRLDEAAAQEHVRPDTLRRWLAEPEFRALIAQDAVEPLLQATSAVIRWAPVAVARLIQDLQGEAPGEARQAAREILKLALETQRELAAEGGKFKAIAYAKAIKAIKGVSGPIVDVAAVKGLPGIGDKIHAKIVEIIANLLTNPDRNCG